MILRLNPSPEPATPNPAPTIRRMAIDWWLSLGLSGRLWKPDNANHLTERYRHVEPFEPDYEPDPRRCGELVDELWIDSIGG